MRYDEILITIVVSIFGTGAFWTILFAQFQKRIDSKSAEKKALLGLLHSSIYNQAAHYIQRKCITADEYENLKKLFDPYEDLGGNGMIKRLMKEVDQIPIVSDETAEREDNKIKDMFCTL